ncbi:MAG: amidohydrolase family protein [Oscillospiraceae bacterium]
MIIYKNAKIVTMGKAGIIENGVIAVDSDRISKVCEAAEFREGDFAGIEHETKDLKGMTVLPGLVNSHHHSAMWKVKGGVDEYLYDLTTEALMAQRAINAALSKGVLALRDLGHYGDGHMAVKKAIQNGFIYGPKMWAAVGIIGFNGGMSPNFCLQMKTIEEMRAEIRRQAAEKTDFIKLMGNHETLYHYDFKQYTCPWFSKEALSAATEEAHGIGLKVAVHANGTEMIDRCISTDVDVIEHGCCMSSEQAGKLAAKGMTYVPTLSGSQGNADPYWERGEIRVRRYRKKWELMKVAAKNAVENGVNVVAGTDTLGSVAEEIQLLHSVAGMTPMEALEAATIKGAALMEMDDKIGSVEEGKCADFIMVDGDPLKDLSILENSVKYISLDGKFWETRQFADMIRPNPMWAPGF